MPLTQPKPPGAAWLQGAEGQVSRTCCMKMCFLLYLLPKKCRISSECHSGCAAGLGEQQLPVCSHCGCSPSYCVYSSTSVLGEVVRHLPWDVGSPAHAGRTHWELVATWLVQPLGSGGVRMAESCSECSQTEWDPWGKEAHSTCKMQFSSAHPGCSWLVSLPAAPAPSV